MGNKKEVTLEQAKKILNKGKKSYSDEEVQKILNLIKLWGRINARTITNKLNEQLLQEHQSLSLKKKSSKT